MQWMDCSFCICNVICDRIAHFVYVMSYAIVFMDQRCSRSFLGKEPNLRKQIIMPSLWFVLHSWVFYLICASLSIYLVVPIYEYRCFVDSLINSTNISKFSLILTFLLNRVAYADFCITYTYVHKLRTNPLLWIVEDFFRNAYLPLETTSRPFQESLEAHTFLYLWLICLQYFKIGIILKCLCKRMMGEHKQLNRHSPTKISVQNILTSWFIKIQAWMGIQRPIRSYSSPTKAANQEIVQARIHALKQDES